MLRHGASKDGSRASARSRACEPNTRLPESSGPSYTARRYTNRVAGRAVIRSFRTTGTDDVFHGRDTLAARRACPIGLWRVARRKLEYLDSAGVLNDLRVLPGNRLEALRGDRAGQYSIRINKRYRLCFRWTARGPTDVEIVDYH